MTKEFEALETLIGKTGCMNDTCANLNECLKSNFCKYNTNDLPSYPMCPDYEMAKTLKNALQELQAIKEAEPSEAMEEVKQIKFYVGTIIGLEFVKGNDVFSEAKKQDYEIFKIKCGKIEQALIKAEKLEKENKFLKDALNTLIKIDDSDISHLKIKAIPQNVAANQDVIKLLKEMLE